MNHLGSSFLCGCAAFTDLIFFSKELDELIEREVVNSSFFVWDGEVEDGWIKYDEAVEWRAMGFATIKPANGNRIALAIGSSGQCFEVDPVSLRKNIGLIKEGITALRCISSIGDTIYAAGMGRRVFERISTDKWKEIGPGEKKSDKDTVVGYEDIAGFSNDDIYAVGWQGEIWRYQNKVWKQTDSPTSGNFNALTCAKNGLVYAVGDNGLMLRGKEDTWEILETERLENLLDVAYYEGDVFVITDYRLLKLKDNSLVEVTNFKNDDRPASCISLSEAKDGVVLMGNKDLFNMKDGEWRRIV